MDKISLKNTFNLIENNINKVIEETKREVSRETMKGNYDFIEKTLKTLKKIESIKIELKSISTELNGIEQNTTTKHFGKNKLSRGKKVQQKEYYIPILRTIVSLGGAGDSKLVLERVYTMMQDRFSEYDYGKINSRNEVRWYNTARWARKAMVDMGYLSNNSSYGIWEITERGKEFLDMNSK